MGVFGPVFGRSGDVGFSGPLLEASSGVVGFNVATLSRREREKGHPAHEKWLKIGVFWRAGRVFSRKSCWRGGAGRVLSRQPVLRRSWMQRGALQAGCGGGFAALEALPRRVGVPMMQFPPWGDAGQILEPGCMLCAQQFRMQFPCDSFKI